MFDLLACKRQSGAFCNRASGSGNGGGGNLGKSPLVDVGGKELLEGYYCEAGTAGVGWVKNKTMESVTLALPSGDMQFTQAQINGLGLTVVFADVCGTKLQCGQSVEATLLSGFGDGTVQTITDTMVTFSSGMGNTDLKQHEIKRWGIRVKGRRSKAGWCC